MRHVSRFLAMSAGVACAATLVYAAPQSITGKSFSVKDPKPGVDATKRRIVGVGKEKSSPNPLVGNPTLAGTAGGAILEVFAGPPNSTNQVFVLPQDTGSTGKPFWTAIGTTGYKYKDPKGDQQHPSGAAVRLVTIKKSASGAFSIKVKVSGKHGSVTLLPPNPGNFGCVALKLGQAAGAGDRYSVEFGAGSTFKNVGNQLFKAKKPTGQGACPSPTTPYGSPSRAFLEPSIDLLD